MNLIPGDNELDGHDRHECILRLIYYDIFLSFGGNDKHNRIKVYNKGKWLFVISFSFFFKILKTFLQ